MTIPAGDKFTRITTHVFVFYDDVFEDLIQDMAKVDISVGIGGAVMKNIFGSVPVFFQDLFIEIDCIPGLDLFGFAFTQVGLHGKGCLRKI